VVGRKDQIDAHRHARIREQFHERRHDRAARNQRRRRNPARAWTRAAARPCSPLA
jgi:hypothetical protein